MTRSFHARRISRALAASIVAAASAAGCGAMQPCDIGLPTTAAAATDRIQGVWLIRDAAGELDGQIFLGASDMQTSWEQTTLYGTWSLTGSNGNAHGIVLQVDRVREGEVPETYASPSPVNLTLVFATPDRVFATQPDGGWTVWERVVGAQ